MCVIDAIGTRVQAGEETPNVEALTQECAKRYGWNDGDVKRIRFITYALPRMAVARGDAIRLGVDEKTLDALYAELSMAEVMAIGDPQQPMSEAGKQAVGRLARLVAARLGINDTARKAREFIFLRAMAVWAAQDFADHRSRHEP